MEIEIVAENALRALIPPPRLCLSEWIEEHIVLPEGVSAQPGPVELWPFQREIADAIGDPAIERVTLVKPVRVGFTTLLTSAVASFVANEPAPILCLLPAEADCRDYMVSDVEPIFSASPAVSKALAYDLDGDDRNTLMSRRFPGGSLKVVAAKSPRNLRRHNVRVLFMDEVDGMEPTSEGSPILLAEKRTLSFPDRKIVLGSTPVHDETSNVLRAYQESDARVFEVPCPECGVFAQLEWGGMIWDDDAPETARWKCPHCAEEIEEKHKPTMVENGQWRAMRPDVKGHAGFHLNALVSLHANASWSQLVREFLVAKKDPTTLQTFVNTILAQGWNNAGVELNDEELAERAEAFGLDRLPEEVLMITAGVDVQHDRLEATIVGYTIEAHSDEVDQATGQRLRIATKWTLVEASLVAVPADAASTVRSGAMPETTGAAQPQTPENGGTTVQTRANINAEIRSMAETFELPQQFVDELIDQGATTDQARAAALTELQQRQASTVRTRVTNVRAVESPQDMIRAMGEAQFARAHPTHELGERARDFAGMTTLDLARDCLTRAGETVTGGSASSLVTRALQTTSDYPLIFADTVNRTLMASYQAAPATLKAVSKQSSARDFRRKTKIQLGEGPTLERVNEHGEFKSGSIAEAKESYAIDTFGRIVGFTRKALINDDIGALTDPAAKLGAGASDFEAQFLVDLLESGNGFGPEMDDGKALFHEDHGNLEPTGAALSQAALSSARLGMRTQTGLAGRRINVSPKYLVVPPELETDAEKLLAAIQPSQSGDVNPFSGKLSLLVEARLSSATRWYVVADPAMIDGLEYSYLQGEEGPQIETRAGFEVDGMEFKVRLDFGAAFLDHRSWYSSESE